MNKDIDTYRGFSREKKQILRKIQQDDDIIRYIRDLPTQWKRDKDIILAVVKQDPSGLQYASEDLIDDEDFVLAAVGTNGLALQFAPEKDKRNATVVKEAVRKNWKAFQFASEELKNNPQFVLTLVKRDSRTLQFATEELKNDPAFLLEVVKEDFRVLDNIPDQVRDKLTGMKEFKDIILEVANIQGILPHLCIVSLDLSNMNINDRNLATLSKELKYNTSVREINLEFNKITDQGVEDFLTFLLTKDNKTGHYNIPNLERLKLGGNLFESSRPHVRDFIQSRNMDIELSPLLSLQKRYKQLENKNQLTEKELNQMESLRMQIEKLMIIQNKISQTQKLLQQSEQTVRTQK